MKRILLSTTVPLLFFAVTLFAQPAYIVHHQDPPEGRSGDIEIIPYDSTLIVDPDGGFVCFDVVINNYDSRSVLGYVWAEVYCPATGRQWEPLNLVSMTLGPHETFMYEDGCLYVPWCIDGGLYQLIGKVGCYPFITDTDTITFYKDGGGDWDCPPNFFIELNTILPSGTVVSECQRIEGETVPGVVTIGEVYPNPFNASTNVKFSLYETTDVEVKIFDLLGEEVVSLVNRELYAGTHEVTWDASMMSSGIYFVEIKAGSAKLVKKLTLVK